MFMPLAPACGSAATANSAQRFASLFNVHLSDSGPRDPHPFENVSTGAHDAPPLENKRADRRGHYS